jgi:hypothetical protein
MVHADLFQMLSFSIDLCLLHDVALTGAVATSIAVFVVVRCSRMYKGARGKGDLAHGQIEISGAVLQKGRKVVMAAPRS